MKNYWRSDARVITTETEALEKLNESIDENFVQACLHMLDCKGRVVVLGMGKSGHIGNKIAATLASTGDTRFLCTSWRGKPRRSRHD